MSKFFCTLSMFLLITMAVPVGIYALVVVQVPCPIWFSYNGRCPLLIAVCAVAAVGLSILLFWMIADAACSALRGWRKGEAA